RPSPTCAADSPTSFRAWRACCRTARSPSTTTSSKMTRRSRATRRRRSCRRSAAARGRIMIDAGRRGAMVHLTPEPIDYHALTEKVRRGDCGAVVTFLGTVRDLTGDRVTVALEYEAYPGMAEKKMREIEADARERWPLGEIAIEHRLGRLE